eukprot:768767-Hanusia_phi.AAC.6
MYLLHSSPYILLFYQTKQASSLSYPSLYLAILQLSRSSPPLSSLFLPRAALITDLSASACRLAAWSRGNWGWVQEGLGQKWWVLIVGTRGYSGWSIIWVTGVGDGVGDGRGDGEELRRERRERRREHAEVTLSRANEKNGYLRLAFLRMFWLVAFAIATFGLLATAAFALPVLFRCFDALTEEKDQRCRSWRWPTFDNSCCLLEI